MGRSRADQHIQAYDQGISEKGSFDTTVERVSRYFAPTYDTLNIDPKDSEIAMPNTSAGIIAQRTLIAGLYSNTVSMGRGVLTSTNPKKRDDELVKRFYGAVGKKANDIIMGIMPQQYLKMLPYYTNTSVGIGFIAFDEKTEEHSIMVYDQRNCVWFEDSKGRPNKMLRGFEYTAEQAIEEFGADNVGDEVLKAYNDQSKSNQKFEYIHVVQKRRKRNEKRLDAKNMAYEELYIERKSKKIVRESGYKRFRYVVVVMNQIEGRMTGYSSSMFSLPSMRTLVRGTDDYYDAVEMATGPTLLLNDRDSVEDAKGGLTPYNILYANMKDGDPFMYGGQSDPTGVMKANETLRDEIYKLHFNDLFNALDQFKSGEKTAFEVAKIIAEKIHMIAPIVHPLKNNWFAPTFEIVSEDIMENRLIDDEKPEILTVNDEGEPEGDVFQVKYTSRVDTQANGVETENLLMALMECAQIEKAVGEGLFTKSKFVLGEAFQTVLEARAIEPEIYRNEKDAIKEFEKLVGEAKQAADEQAIRDATSKTPMSKAVEPGSPNSLITEAERDVAV